MQLDFNGHLEAFVNGTGRLLFTEFSTIAPQF